MPTANCPECEEDVYVDADSEQGDEIACEECGSELVLVGLDPIELDLRVGSEDDDADVDDYESSDYVS